MVYKKGLYTEEFYEDKMPLQLSKRGGLGFQAQPINFQIAYTSHATILSTLPSVVGVGLVA